MLSSTGTGRDRLDARWGDDDELEALGGEDDEGHLDGADADHSRLAERQRRADQQEGAAERGEDGDDQYADAAEVDDDQILRAEGEGMVTEHAKISATDPGPEPLPEPDPSEPEPDHGPEDPAWEQPQARH
jgi:hypothetical protein